jgi:6-phosphogluconolactonase
LPLQYGTLPASNDMKILSATQGLDAAFDEAARSIFALFSTKSAAEPLVLGLCGGRSVVGLLQALRRVSSDLPQELMRRVQFFMVDERLVPLTDEQSNFGGLKKLLFDELIDQGVIALSQLHPFVPDETQPDYGCTQYGAELNAHGGKFTCVVLGVGEDGHVAGLFPHNAVLSRSEAGFVSFFDSPKPPPQRMTATRQLLVSADLAILLVLGEGKRDAWNRFQGEATLEADCPSVLVKGMKDALVVTDLS